MSFGDDTLDPANQEKQMTIEDLLKEARSIWGPAGDHPDRMSSIVVRLGVTFGDLCRHARRASKDPTDAEDLKKELGNVIFSTIRWCDDMGFDPVECITSAIAAQQRFAAANRKR